MQSQRFPLFLSLPSPFSFFLLSLHATGLHTDDGRVERGGYVAVVCPQRLPRALIVIH